MSRLRRAQPGAGVVWLVSDRLDDGYLCYWYGGANDSHLLERTRAPSAADAIAWGRERTPRVRIRTGQARTYWAGSGPAPDGFVDRWGDGPVPDQMAVT